MTGAEFKTFFEGYLKSLDYQMRSSFLKLGTALQQMEEGYDANYLKFESSIGEVEGIALINMDHTCQSEFRAYIRHITVKKRSNFNDVLAQTVEFVWKKMLADTIRIDLYHYKEENDPTGKLTADTELKTSLGMNRRGFKWKTVINDPETD